MKIEIDYDFMSRQENEKASNYLGCDLARFLNEFKNQFDGNLQDGYAPFCKTFVMLNTIGMKYGLVKRNHILDPFIVTEYKKRRENELPIVQQSLPLSVLKAFGSNRVSANFIFVEMYSREQMIIEAFAEGKNVTLDNYPADYYIFNAKPLMDKDEVIPAAPSTILINALGTAYGGSGKPLDREEYMKSVKFFSENVYVDVNN